MRKLTGVLLVMLAISGMAQNSMNLQHRPVTIDLAKRTWQGIPGIERSGKGRVFVSWYTGGEREPSPEQIVLLCYSDDNGITFNEPHIMGAQKNGARCYDPRLWIDPNGRLWYIFNRSNKETAVHGVYARICNNPDLAIPVFGEEFRVGFDVPYDFGMNKPTVLSSGEWIMPVTYATDSIHDWFAGSKQLQGVGISGDKGKTWKLFGSVKAPEWALEPMITELKDGRLWMLIRTGSGFLWESYSNNKGQTWSEAKTTSIANPGSRFFIRRLSSGNLLLVNHYRYDGRSHLAARISTNEGATWNEGLLLDERGGTIYANGVIGGVSYPDGVQDKNGLIWIVYDRNRNGEGEILLAKFREEDVLAGRNVSGAVTLKQVINMLEKPNILPIGWDPKEAADKVMARLIKVTAPEVKGAHDAGLTIKGDRAFIVSNVGDVRAGENAVWPEIYLTLSIVNIKTLVLEKNIPFAKGGQVFENDTLQIGACFDPRILVINDTTLRCFFASENPGVRQSQTFYRDFRITRQKFEDQIQKVKIKTSLGIFDMQPQYLYADAKVYGFSKPAADYGLYLIDAFKLFDGKIYAVVNNYISGQNSLALVHDNGELFEVIGHYNLPNELKLCESSVNRLPDGTWMAICRQDGGNNNYFFTYSADGKKWSPGKELPIIPNGWNSKPTFDKFGGIYYLGWQEATMIQGVYRSVFNVDISRDGKNWERKYRFESEKSFQYPSFYEYNGNIWLAVTQGDTDVSRKERIMFGKLE